MAEEPGKDNGISYAVNTVKESFDSAEDTLLRLRRLSEHEEYEKESSSSVQSYGASNSFAYSAILRVRNIYKGSHLRIFFVAVFRFCLIFITMTMFAISLVTDRFFYWNRQKRQKRQAKGLHFILSQILGGAMIKVGQQLSLRYDLLPIAYCEELSNLLEDVPPFRKTQAIRIIEKQLGKNIYEVFHEAIELVGSASIACVYKARLLNGDDVAIKVRRPGIVTRIIADLTALGWLLKLLEFLNIISYGNTKNLRAELHEILMEELNFRTEIRYQELYKKYYDQNASLKVSAPAVYYEYSGEDVIVSEFIDGINVNDILKAIERGNRSQLDRISAFGINPKIIAKRIIKASFFGLFECPFFHGDPHPANIFVLKGNRVIMVDFGACGVFSDKERTSMHEMHYYYSKNDVGGMVRSLVSLMEPLPPMDVNNFINELENKWWKEFYGVKSDHPEWWERTSMGLWLSLLTLGRKYRVPLPSRMLRMVRATLLYDTVAARLYKKIDVFEEYREYYLEKCHDAKWDLKTKTIQQMILGPDDEHYYKVERLITLAEEMVFKLEKFVSQPLPNFGAITNKIYDALRMGLQWFIHLIIISLFMFGLAFILNENPLGKDWFKDLRFTTGNIGLPEILMLVWLVLISLFTYSYMVRTYNRFGDKDI